MSDDVTIGAFSAADLEAEIAGLGELMRACVAAGGSVGYVMPFAQADAEAFWRRHVAPALAAGGRVMLVARAGGRIAGSVQLDHDTPPNQPHRAEVRKLLVHPDFRRRGIARRLMAEIEVRAARLARRLLTLDTRTGDAAEPLYASLGYRTTGTIPGYCRDNFVERYDPTTIMYKELALS
jgi:ribosomal protein S18 acetylase RimI-like enzyme